MPAPDIIANLTAHLEMAAIATVAVCGMLAAVMVAYPFLGRTRSEGQSGSCTLVEDLGKKKEEEFSEVRWGPATNAVIP